MRKSERELKSFDELVDVLQRCDTIRLGIHDEPYPYIVPLSFGLEVVDGVIHLYIHGAQEGKKHDLIAKDPHVCVEADICHRFVDTGHSITTEYESVIGYGTVEKVFAEEAVKGLDLLLAHCGYEGYNYDHAVTSVLTVYRITLHCLTGKRRTV